MSDKEFVNRYMRVVVAMGAAVMLFSAAGLPPIWRLGWPYLILGTLTITIGSRITINFFRFNSSISISDIFIFLTMLLFDGEAAIFLAALEGLISSLRITKSHLKMAFNSASMACATFATVWLLRLTLGAIPDVAQGPFSSQLVMMASLMALTQYIVNSGMVAVAGARLAGRPFWA